ncbi:class I SAM-dependent methyltransferase [Neobacillus dielmonensis]|uniref:class I SAM-dependent methyltransferase n=1 Tax=Neobacillus dielmonensis TaxID=1347369 RepID=UPI0005A831A2|nr:class I SAM-dependent methyltransferase [Neobacillus dielmonensis]
MSYSTYGELCTEVYDVTKPIGSFWGMDYYLDRLKEVKGPILEAMAGSGRILIPLLEAGLSVDGSDSSRSMLASCEQRCAERGITPNLYEGSLQELSLPNKYDAIFIGGASFLLIENRDDSLQALDRIYHQLNKAGKLIIDLELPSPDLEIERIKTSTVILPDGHIITIENKLVEVDWYNQFTVSYIKYEKWNNGVLVNTELQRFALRWYGIEEFKMILEKIGFTDIIVSADYQFGNQPTKSTTLYTFECIKR